MPEQQSLGSWQGVTLDIAAWDAVAADVDLSFACMFTHELDGEPRGGLLHLNQALSGRLVQLRDEGVFLGAPMETLLISKPPTTFAARAVMVIGMGVPSQWATALTAQAVATAVRAATQLRVASAAFAPSLLDAGIAPNQTTNTASEMMKAVTLAIDAQVSLATNGLAPAPSLRRWVFDVGAAGFAAAAGEFRATLDQLKAG
ncbi:M17 family peptidase N-terminal domain-containing protein [Dyella solisilvae]|uniref:M17 family peptidase N-terminal domain-containing protein n=1 Tax=Dyella solisilvae TaxID=1920168 RepID=UPI001F3AD843|nr:M17 family peptidase N-terminal domain-containing protein [Dyella solisilvae]